MSLDIYTGNKITDIFPNLYGHLDDRLNVLSFNCIHKVFVSQIFPNSLFCWPSENSFFNNSDIISIFNHLRKDKRNSFDLFMFRIFIGFRGRILRLINPETKLYFNRPFVNISDMMVFQIREM